jgi:hypothetical protein
MQAGRVVTSRGKNLDDQGMRRHTKKEPERRGPNTLSPKKYWMTWISEKMKFVLNAQRFLTGFFMLKW